MTNRRFNSIVTVALLSLVLMLGSATSAVLFTSKSIAFAQNSGNSALQAGYQPSIDHLANLIHNKTGIDEFSVKPILEQMALQILKTNLNPAEAD